MTRPRPHRRVRATQKALAALFLLLAPAGAVPSLRAQAAGTSIVHRTAPNFSRLDLHHKKIDLNDYRGKVVLLNFWATWCGPCLTEMPIFNKWQKQYGPGRFQVIGISMDDAAPEVVATVSKLQLTYPVLMGDEHLGTAYGGILGLPVTFLIRPDGKIRARYEGAADLVRIRRDVENLLKTP